MTIMMDIVLGRVDQGLEHKVHLHTLDISVGHDSSDSRQSLTDVCESERLHKRR